MFLNISRAARGVRPGNIQNGSHSVRTAQLPQVPWSFDSRYCGKTAKDVISKFKKKAFPVGKFPEELLDKKVEEIAAMAERMQLKRAVDALALLNDAKFHNDNNQLR